MIYYFLFVSAFIAGLFYLTARSRTEVPPKKGRPKDEEALRRLRPAAAVRLVSIHLAAIGFVKRPDVFPFDGTLLFKTPTGTVLVSIEEWASPVVDADALARLERKRGKGGWSRAWCATAGRFTPKARAYAREKGLGLLDGAQLLTAPPERPSSIPKKSRRSESSPSGGDPVCPECGRPLKRRKIRRGPHAGAVYYACTGFPVCRYTLGLPKNLGILS